MPGARRATGRVIARSTHSQIIRRIESRICCGTIRRVSKLNQQALAQMNPATRPPRAPNVASWTRTTENPGLAPGSTNGITSPVHGTWNMVHIPSSLLSLSDEKCGTTRSTNVGSLPSFHAGLNRQTWYEYYDSERWSQSANDPKIESRPFEDQTAPTPFLDLTLIQPGCGAHC